MLEQRIRNETKKIKETIIGNYNKTLLYIGYGPFLRMGEIILEKVLNPRNCRTRKFCIQGRNRSSGDTFLNENE